MKNKKGFTLVEILAVLSIIALLMVIAIPGINKLSNKMKDKGTKSEINLIEKAAVLYAENNSNSIKSHFGTCPNEEESTDYCENKSKCIKKDTNDSCTESIADYKYKCYVKLTDLIELGYYTNENENATITAGVIEIFIDADYKTSSATYYSTKDDMKESSIKNCITGSE